MPPRKKNRSLFSKLRHRLGRRQLLLASLALFTGLTLILFLHFHRGGSPLRAEGGAQGPSAQAGARPVPISVAPARKGDIGNYIEALGTVTPVNTVTLLSRVQGQITAVHYREGQNVSRGDALVDIDPRPYEAALLQAQGSLARDQAALVEARIDLARYRKAYAQRAIPKQQLDDQEQVVRQDNGAVQADEGAVLGAKANLDYCHITSPVDGRVGLRLVDAGNIVQANSTTALAVVTQLQPISVIFSVAEDRLPEIRSGLGGDQPMEVDAYDRSQEKKITSGLFLTLDNQIDVTTGTVRIRAIFDNRDGSLFPNQFVNARLLVHTERDATLVSAPAIQRGTDGTFVYVIDTGKKTAQMRTVKVGTTEGDTTAVEGINPGDQVAVSGFDKLEDGAHVMVTEPKTESSPAPERAPHQLAGAIPPQGAPKEPLKAPAPSSGPSPEPKPKP